MNQDKLKLETQQIQQKLKEIQQKMVQQIEQGRFYGLDQQVRQIQRQIMLGERV